MNEILGNIINTLHNALQVLSNDINHLSQKSTEEWISIIIYGGLAFSMFYFPSKWFRAYLIRLFLFVLGANFFWISLHHQSLLYNATFYAGLGLMIPHIEIVEITYLILRERTLYVYDKMIQLLLLIISPFIFLFHIVQTIYQFIRLKTEQFQNFKEEKRYQKEQREFEKQQQREAKQQEKEQQQNFQDEFKRQQEEAYKQEQNKYDEADKKRQGSKQQYQKKKQNNQSDYSKQNKQQEPPKQEFKQEQKSESRWDSSDPYVVLGIDRDATAKEIKKAYHNLSKIYHPDLSLFDKEKSKAISQKINGAYAKLKRK